MPIIDKGVAMFCMRKSILGLAFVVFNLNAVEYDRIVYIIPPNGYQNEKLFDMNDAIYNRDDCMRPFYDLRESFRQLGCDLKTTTIDVNRHLEKLVGLIVCGVPSDYRKLVRFKRCQSAKMILLLLEPPVVVPYYYDRKYHGVFDQVFTMFDDQIDGKKYHKLYYPQSTLNMIDNVPSFDEKKFCVIVASNKSSKHPQEQYSERLKIANFLKKKAPQDFDLFGHDWPDNTAKPIASKMETLKNYKFCICYENMKNQDGYVTEKIFDVFLAGSVPVYKGAKNIDIYVDKNCFIDRNKFDSDESLYEFLQQMTAQEYDTYLVNIKNYLKSDKAFLFSSENFAHTLIMALIK